MITVKDKETYTTNNMETFAQGRFMINLRLMDKPAPGFKTGVILL